MCTNQPSPVRPCKSHHHLPPPPPTRSRSSLSARRHLCFSCGAPRDGSAPEAILDPKKLFLGGVPKDTSSETLREYFGQYGAVTDAFCMKARNFGFVAFETEEAAQLVLTSGPHFLEGKELDIKPTTVPDPKSMGGKGKGAGKGKGKGKGWGFDDPYDAGSKRPLGQIDNVPMTPGDWRCNQCGNLNFARRTGK